MEGLEQLLSVVGGLGAAAGPVFALLWWLERGERKELQGKLEAAQKTATEDKDELLRESITAINTAAGGIKEVAVAVNEVKTGMSSIGEIVRSLLTKRAR